MSQLDLSGSTPEEVRKQVELTAVKIANRIRDLIKERVPFDTGQLHDDIRTILPGDELLSESEDYGALVLTKE
jgi:hypothetical protein